MEQKMPRIMISAPNSGSGKTTIVCGILKALMNMGKRVAAFKSGPDYIDPMFHSKVLGAKSRNLDIFMLGKDTTRFLAAKNSVNADVSVFEGAMGFYDGMGKTVNASAYDLAATCGVPIVLVVNGRGAALSVAAIINGFKNFRSDSNIVGAILNNVNPMTYAFYKDAIEAETGVKLLGYFPVMEGCNFESRHLGLVTAEEIGDLQQIVDKLAVQAEKSLDLELLLELAGQAAPLSYVKPDIEYIGKTRIAVAQDRAFCFYYQDALELLEEMGAELVPFSPVNDEHLPACDGLFLGGGYPELYAGELEANTSMLADIKSFIGAGKPCYAECGGFMYLLERYADKSRTYNWVGAIEGESHLTDKLVRFGYLQLTAQKDNLLCKAGESINAHEFHYSDSSHNGDGFAAVKASGKGAWECAVTSSSLYAGYPHMHLYGNIGFAKNFVKACLQKR